MVPLSGTEYPNDEIVHGFFEAEKKPKRQARCLRNEVHTDLARVIKKNAPEQVEASPC